MTMLCQIDNINKNYKSIEIFLKGQHGTAGVEKYNN